MNRINRCLSNIKAILRAKFEYDVNPERTYRFVNNHIPNDKFDAFTKKIVLKILQNKINDRNSTKR